MTADTSPLRVPDPMLATLGAPPAGPGWAVEFKWDGFRGRLRSAGSTVSVYTRNGAEALSTFPELAGVPAGLGRDLVLDGEIVALDRFGRPSFTRLQRRWPMRRRPSSALVREVPVRLFVFDVTAIGDTDLTTRPYIERRQVLDELAAASTSDVLVVPPSWQGVDPRHMLAAAADQSVEGIVSKRIDSHYVSGRSRDWIKSPVRISCELAIVGWWPPSGPSRRNEIGSLLLAGRGPDGSLSVVGQVATGFSEAERRRLYALLAKVPSVRAPLVPEPATNGVHWVDPVHVGEVAFREYVPGRGLRHASWKGLRDKASDTIGMPPISGV
jgi:bifunctional non-homologous end joining protein LigD